MAQDPSLLPGRRTTAFLLLCTAVHLSIATSFVPSIQSPRSTAATLPVLFSTPSPQEQQPKKKNLDADFDYQELKIQLRAMKEQNLESAANRLQDAKRGELEGYVRRILARRESSVPLWNLASQLPGTNWRLGFSTQAVTNESLPSGAQVQLKFRDDKRVDYILEFTKTWGLNKLTAESYYQVDSSPVHPGWVTYTYDKITTDVLGFQNLGLGNLMKGRTSVIQTVYFDSDMWIEMGKDGPYEYFNVYVREVDDSDSDWNNQDIDLSD